MKLLAEARDWELPIHRIMLPAKVRRIAFAWPRRKHKQCANETRLSLTFSGSGSGGIRSL